MLAQAIAERCGLNCFYIADSGGVYLPIPRSPDDLLARPRCIDFGTAKGNGIFLFIKEIGSDILFTLL